MELVCTKKCFYGGQLYKVGDLLSKDVEEAPAHFKERGAVETPIAPDEQVKTLSEITAKNAREERIAALRLMNKDDLVAEAVRLGLSKDKDLIALTKFQILELIQRSEAPEAPAVPAAPVPAAPVPAAPEKPDVAEAATGLKKAVEVVADIFT